MTPSFLFALRLSLPVFDVLALVLSSYFSTTTHYIGFISMFAILRVPYLIMLQFC